MMLIALMSRVSRGPQGPRPVDPVSAAPPWAVLCPEGTVTVPLERAAEVLPRLLPGTPVALVADRPLARRPLRRLAAEHGVRVGRELVALPTASQPLVLLDDDAPSVARLWAVVAAVPPAPGWVTAPATLVLAVAARLPWRWTGALAPGRVVIGERR